jgi:hypothetical protein
LLLKKRIMLAPVLPLLDWKKPILVNAGFGKICGKTTLLNELLATSFETRCDNVLHYGSWEISISRGSASRAFHMVDIHEDVTESAAVHTFVQVLASVLRTNVVMLLHFKYPEREKVGCSADQERSSKKGAAELKATNASILKLVSVGAH